MLQFGRTKIERFVDMRDIITAIVNDDSINYQLLMPVILFLHSIS